MASLLIAYETGTLSWECWKTSRRCSLVHLSVIRRVASTPFMPGLELLRGISDGACQGSVVGVTGCGDEEVAVRALKAEAWYH